MFHFFTVTRTLMSFNMTLTRVTKQQQTVIDDALHVHDNI